MGYRLALAFVVLVGCHAGKKECGDAASQIAVTADALMALDKAAGKSDADFAKARADLDKQSQALAAIPDPKVNRAVVKEAFFARDKFMSALPKVVDAVAVAHSSLAAGKKCRPGVLPPSGAKGARYPSSLASLDCFGEPSESVHAAYLDLITEANLASPTLATDCNE